MARSLGSMSHFFVAKRSIEDLGWPKLLAALAARTSTARGAEGAKALPFLETREAILTSYAQIDEGRTLLRLDLLPPLGAVEDVRDFLSRAHKQAILLPNELLAVARLMHAAASVRRFLRARGESSPILAERATALLDRTGLAREIEAAIEPSGSIRDNATPTLAEYRQRARELHRQIRTHIEGMLHDGDFTSLLQDNYYSVRAERYVLPVNASFRHKVPGIVHNASQSGQTIFVEPQQIVPLGNDLAIAQSLALEEERRILQAFSNDVGDIAKELGETLELLAQIDVIFAAAKLAHDLDAEVPELVEGRVGFHLRAVRHPLLMLQERKVVANTVTLADKAHALVISGPNAGGKTVTMSTVGLCALMTRAGLPIPVAQGSSMPVFQGVSAAIGDAQDMSRGLSTFSGHVAVLKEIVDVARHGWLVLVDEIAADTDPKEGAALACAILETLVEQGARVLVTTHLEEVKALGVTDERYVNARVGFDAATLKPNFALQLGAAGMSNALAVAQAAGFSAAVMDKARTQLAASGVLSLALARLETLEQTLAMERASVQAALSEAQQLREQAAQEKHVLEQTRAKLQIEVRRELQPELDAARAQVSQMIAQLQAQPSMQKTQQAQAFLQARAQELAAAEKRAEERSRVAKEDIAESAQLQEGTRVRVLSLGREGEVLSCDGDSAMVAMGMLRSRVSLSDLVPLRAGKNVSVSPFGTNKLKPADVAASAVVSPDIRCDVRGFRADDALRALDKALDQSFSEGATLLQIVHGHGTGVLKDLLRKALRESPYVAAFRPGDRHEGGDGVTMVTVKS